MLSRAKVAALPVVRRPAATCSAAVANEPDDGDGEPAGGQRAVEVAGALASPDDLLELGGASLMGGRVAGLRAPGEGGAGWAQRGARHLGNYEAK